MNPITPAELTVQKSVKSIETRGESAVKCGGDDAERGRDWSTVHRIRLASAQMANSSLGEPREADLR